MNAVIALPDEEHTNRVIALWDDVEREFGVHEARAHVPWPHVSLQGADEYDFPAVEALLRSVANDVAPLIVPRMGWASLPVRSRCSTFPSSG